MSKSRILVVEDTRLLRKIYVERLSADGYEVLSAGDGVEALDVMAHEHVDLVLLDLIMPRMGGIEVLEVMRANPRLHDLPVLILSNLGEQEDIERAISLGALDYLIKNEAKPAEVSAKIQATLEHLAGRIKPVETFRVLMKDRVGDAERLVAFAGLPRRFWCPACEVELVLEIIPNPDKPGWYESHIVCPMCSREFR